jgi:hypothetical protein
LWIGTAAGIAAGVNGCRGLDHGANFRFGPGRRRTTTYCK